MKANFWVLLFLFIVSRFLFLANYPHFYDSPEYYRHSLSTDFFKTIASSHESIHPIYIFLIQTSQKIFSRFLSQPQVWRLSLISAIFGLSSFVTFYFLVKRWFNQKIALLALLPLIFFPHLWLIQTNVLHEAVEQGLFLLGLLFFDLFLEKKKTNFFVLTLITWALAIVNFLGILIWFPAVVGLAIFRSQKEDLSRNISWGVALGLISWLVGSLMLYLILIFSASNPLSRLKLLMIGYGSQGILSNWTLLNFLRVLRNDWLIGVNGYSIPAIIGAIFAFLFLLRKKEYRILLLVASYLFSFFLTGKFWYGGLFGRYSSLVVYPLALLLALVAERKIYFFGVIGLIITFLPVFIAYQKTPIPKIQSSIIDQSGLTQKDLLILSDYQRPQLFYENALYLGGDRQLQKRLEEKIEAAVKERRRVFISQQAITFPYWQYDGQLVHIISKGDNRKAQLRKFLEDKELTLMAQDKNYPLLSVYEIKK